MNKYVIIIFLFVGIACFAQEYNIIYKFNYTSMFADQPDVTSQFDSELIIRTDISSITIKHTMFNHSMGDDPFYAESYFDITLIYNEIEYYYELGGIWGSLQEVLKKLADYINNLVIE